MKYKLIAADMDGTLLNSRGIITDKTQNAIKAVKEKGVIFTICTGRPIQGVEFYINMLNLDCPVITYNGAMIVIGKTKEIIFEQGLMSEDARIVLALGKEFKTTIIVWSGNKLYANVLNERVQDYKRIAAIEPILIENEDEIIQKGITKILWYDDVDKIDLFQNVLKERLQDRVNFCTSKPVFLEFFDNRVSKAVAMEKIGEYLGIKREEMIAIGDGFNDLPMIEYAGMGVAMGNAPEEIKTKADYVTLSNDEDGIAFFLENIFNF